MNLINTTVFRLALRFALAFVLIFIVAITSVYFSTFAEIKAQTDSELLHELNELDNQQLLPSIQNLIVNINAREKYGENLRHSYALLDGEKQYLAGNKKLAVTMGSSVKNTDQIQFIEKEMGRTDSDAILRVAYKKSLKTSLYIIVAQEKTSLYELREHTIIAIVLAVFVTLILTLMVGVYMGRTVLKRINRINHGLDQSLAANFEQLLSVPKDDDEFRALTLKLNQMLRRIESLLSGMRQVTDNIAHDLRGPLNRMRSRLDVTLLQPREGVEYRESMIQAVNDCDELLKTFNALLQIAQAEAGIRGSTWQAVNLVLLVDTLVELYQVVAEEKGQKINWSTQEAVFVDGNKDLLVQALSNLIENSMKYTPKNGMIIVELEKINQHPIIRVRDNGPGIPESDRDKVLGRFQRLDSARSSPGNGLGLSLVNAVSKLHNANLLLADNRPGLSVEIRFPVC